MVSGKEKSADGNKPPANGQRLSDLAYKRILENLFDRKLPAGAFVSQSHLVELLGIPVAPLRDALRVLEAEGVLKIHPRSGIEFIKPGLELTKSTYQFRTILERAAVRVFAETAPESLIASIIDQHTEMIERLEKEGLDQAKVSRLDELEALLHDTIIRTLNNPLIENSYKRMHNYLRLVRLDRSLTAPLALRSLREHMQILEACRARDPGKAEEAVQAHFNAALQRHLGIY